MSENVKTPTSEPSRRDFLNFLRKVAEVYFVSQFHKNSIVDIQENLHETTPLMLSLEYFQCLAERCRELSTQVGKIEIPNKRTLSSATNINTINMLLDSIPKPTEIFSGISLLAQNSMWENEVQVHISKLETTSVSWCEEVLPNLLLVVK